MNPSCEFHQWSADEAQKLLKVKGTIQDVDGECTFKLTGSRKGCLVAPHYRLPLYALNKKIGLYRQVVQHLQTLSSTSVMEMRDTYLSVMQYLNDVRIAFLADAGASSNPLHGDFRSPTFDYFLWLDHHCDGFHDEWRDALAEVHQITFEGVKNGECADILHFLDWKVYHRNACKIVDFCGAIQGTGAGEDIQHLLNAVVASMDVATDQASTAEPPAQTLAGGDVTLNASPFPIFPLPFKKECRNRSITALGTHAREYIIVGLGKWLSSHIAMRFREIQGLAHDDPLNDLVLQGYLISATDEEEFLELFGMAELMFRCQDLRVCRGQMARFFRVVGRALYLSREKITCVIDHGRSRASMLEQVTFTLDLHVYDHIADGLSTQDADTTYEIRAAVSTGVQCDPTVECTIQVPGSRSMYDDEVQTDHYIQDSMAVHDPNVEFSVESAGSRSMIDHEVQTDHEIQHLSAVDDTNGESFVDIPVSRSMIDDEVQTDIDVQDSVAFGDSNIGMYEPMVESGGADSLQPDICMSGAYDYSDGCVPFSPTYNDHAGDVSHSTSIMLEASLSMDMDVAHTSSAEHPESQSCDPVPEMSTVPMSIPIQSRLRKRTRTVSTKAPAASSRRRGASKHRGPVIVASKRPVGTKADDCAFDSPTSPPYTIQELVDESRTAGLAVTPCISSFLTDPEGMKLVRSTIDSDHSSWLCIARHVASLSRRDRLSRVMSSMAASLMSFDIWLKDISMECQQVLHCGTGDNVLPPLAHCVIVELSARAESDETAVRSALHNIWTKENAKCVTEVIRYLLHQYKAGETNSYSSGLCLLASVMTERSGAHGTQ
ncbi:hypothetical protein BDR03DRAFT_1018594 [Suillus americanus]|nr:hypothetical protein BDR03DRAFT_1018594 [Suillus americanus]